MSCARVKKYTASDVSKAERHNERKNETYENMNVIEERRPYNVHFKKPFAPTYMAVSYTHLALSSKIHLARNGKQRMLI